MLGFLGQLDVMRQIFEKLGNVNFHAYELWLDRNQEMPHRSSPLLLPLFSLRDLDDNKLSLHAACIIIMFFSNYNAILSLIILFGTIYRINLRDYIAKSRMYYYHVLF